MMKNQWNHKEEHREPEARGGEGVVAGRNAVTEALRSGRPIDTLFVARGLLEKGSVAALAAFLIWMSTEGASPPSSPPIFVACSLADVKDVGKTFFPLVFHYVVPVTILGGLIALGVLPIANA